MKRELAAAGRPLFRLMSHPATRVMDGVKVIMRSIAEMGSAAAVPMRDAALREAAILDHLIHGCFGPYLALSYRMTSISNFIVKFIKCFLGEDTLSL